MNTNRGGVERPLRALGRTSGATAPPQSVPTLSELLDHPESARALPHAEAAAMLAKVGALHSMLLARVAAPEMTPSDPEPAHGRDDPGRWIDADAAAVIANVPRRTIYDWSRRKDWRPFCRRLSRKVLQIEEGGLRALLTRR